MRPNYLHLPFLLFAILSIASVTGCEKDDGFTETAPQVPGSIFIDLNDDGTSDFEIAYGEGVWDGERSSGSVFGGSINPLNGNSVLDTLAGSMGAFGITHTASTGDVLTTNATEPLYWNAFRGGPELIQIFSQGTSPETWPTAWTRTYDSDAEEIFMALKLAHDPDVTPTLGWVKLSVNANSGRIIVLNKGFAVADELLIEE